MLDAMLADPLVGLLLSPLVRSGSWPHVVLRGLPSSGEVIGDRLIVITLASRVSFTRWGANCRVEPLSWFMCLGGNGREPAVDSAVENVPHR